MPILIAEESEYMKTASKVSEAEIIKHKTPYKASF